jgi:putative methionine-R-sulfoxide reductase with GAF domain
VVGERNSGQSNSHTIFMESSTLDRNSSQAGLKTVRPESVRSGSPVAPARTPERLRFPAEDGGKSLSEMAQRDLNAALQLLAERAQYITGASGAAIALREDGEMICRASAGPSAPALGAHLQVNSGLSGESVRTRQILRCDNAELDSRVNRESCRALGIASVVVLPLIREPEVSGVFELFSGRAYAFGERDIIALERLAEMIQTALEHADAARRAEKIGEPSVEKKPAANWSEASANSSIEEEASEEKAFAKLSNEDKPEPKLGAIEASISQETDEPQVVLTGERGNIGTCEACGFPVSEGRKLCLDCESSGTVQDPTAAPFLSQFTAPEESWLRSHQYLIGTLLVIALTIIVLVWMR